MFFSNQIEKPFWQEAPENAREIWNETAQGCWQIQMEAKAQAIKNENPIKPKILPKINNPSRQSKPKRRKIRKVLKNSKCEK